MIWRRFQASRGTMPNAHTTLHGLRAATRGGTYPSAGYVFCLMHHCDSPRARSFHNTAHLSHVNILSVFGSPASSESFQLLVEILRRRRCPLPTSSSPSGPPSTPRRCSSTERPPRTVVEAATTSSRTGAVVPRSVGCALDTGEEGLTGRGAAAGCGRGDSCGRQQLDGDGLT